MSTTSAQRYSIAGGDDGVYGPSFGPVSATEVGLFGSAEAACMVVQLAQPVREGSQEFELLAVRPRYVGVTFTELQSKGGTVGVSLVRQGHESSIRSGLTAENSKYWSIGTITPSEA
jgi:hypothetical protein